ncbi:cysteine hydrolase family protein [Ruminiclostridium papyrosolvens]|uniref:Isochorismatase n=1 Tax=Ruminiclostridium papyrosolvens C7 TaxID=1330534 RepID=U4R7C9_9FIRM|nr:cysteine hydrolase family protein [Ruminiclostridium papyrosolvens]EPR14330.1 isochorismatase [Ruminiclostridium papyrosolvens C7]
MKRALLVIDVQNEYFTGKLPVTYPSDSYGNILKVVDTANDKNIPVILIQHTSPGENAVTFKKGSSEWDIHPDLLLRKYNYIVEKYLPGSFTNTNLESVLKELDIDTVTITGYMTQMCCDTTARQAMHMGYSVEFLSDATGTLQFSNNAGTISAEDLHKAILVTQAARFSKVLSSDEWLKNL